MRLAYPVELNKQANTVLVMFPDIPEALTEAATEEDALAEGADCLVAALGGYIQGGRAIPAPSPALGAEVVELPAVVAAKIALYEAGRAKHLDEPRLAKHLGCTRDAVRVLLDVDSQTPLSRLQAAIHTLGELKPA